MKVHKQPMRTIWLDETGWQINIVDQTRLPHEYYVTALSTVDDAAAAIETMQVRGAPLIGATAAYGMALAMREDTSDEALNNSIELLSATRPTAVNLRWALDQMHDELQCVAQEKRASRAYEKAAQLCARDIECNHSIAQHGLQLIRAIAESKSTDDPVNILTHCNAGWLATVGWGTALAPIYAAREDGIDCHVWVDETRPRNQGAQLTTWELANADVPHTVIADNAGGHLMQTGQVDCCIVGTDRTAANGDVCNKIGTYLKALAAHANDIPFYVALPGSTIDWQARDATDIPIEHRSETEVTHLWGKDNRDRLINIQLTPDNTRACNPAFDVTPATMVTALITERGVCNASADGLRSLFSETQ
ncbi:MAG: S-methyl-5-thioribose-1-phosphate isomerase [Pseudomonadota bacterium]